MFELLIVAAVLTLGLIFNAYFTRVSAERVLGMKIDWVRAILINAVRSCASMLAGFAFGYMIQAGLGGDLPMVKALGLLTVMLASAGVYYLTLNRFSDRKVTVGGFAKVVALESVLTVAAVAVILGILLSTAYLTTFSV